MKLRIRKQPFLLLEVLIAFFLMAMSIIPLLAPHAAILIEQKKFVRQINLDHLVNLLYADIVERLYSNEISWEDIVNETEFEIDSTLLDKLHFGQNLPYKGSYHFKDKSHKPTESSQRNFYLISLYIRFSPIEGPIDKDGNIIGTLNYYYELFLVKENPEAAAEAPKL